MADNRFAVLLVAGVGSAASMVSGGSSLSSMNDKSEVLCRFTEQFSCLALALSERNGRALSWQS
jgi:hypothetical protein